MMAVKPMDSVKYVSEIIITLKRIRVNNYNLVFIEMCEII